MKDKFEHLNNAPIREALIDFRVSNSADNFQKGIEHFSSILADEFPNRKPIKLFQQQINFNEEGIHSNDPVQTMVGERFESSDGNVVVQTQLEGLTVSVLSPYHNWGHLVENFKNVWSKYSVTFLPTGVSRVATRFINEWPIQKDGNELAHYLAMPPQVPKGLPPSIRTHVSHELMDEATQSNLILNQVILDQNTKWQVIVDIDAIRMKEYALSDPKVWIDLENLRILKNRAFFGLLGQSSIEGFK